MTSLVLGVLTAGWMLWLSPPPPGNMKELGVVNGKKDSAGKVETWGGWRGNWVWRVIWIELAG
jgi:hypothetical protein